MKRIIEKLLKTKPQSTKVADFVIAIPRIICGLLLAFDFGSSKFGMPWSSNDLTLFDIPNWFVEDVATFGGLFAIAPYFFAWIAAASETIGGLLLALGFKTRLAALSIMFTMLTAIFFQKWDSGLWSMLPAMGFLWVSLYSLVIGSGRFGIDYLIVKAVERRRLLSLPLAQIKLKPSIAKCIVIVMLFGSYSLVAQERRINLGVDMKGLDARSVGIKGSISPLSWDKIYPLSDQDGDGIYEAEITFNTSKRSLKFKFVNDGQMELEGSDERIAWFQDEVSSKSYSFNEYDFYTKEQLAQIAFTEAQIKEDVALIGKALQHIHPAVYKFTDSVSMQANLAVLEAEMLAQPDLITAYKAISKFTATIKCSHTFTNPWNQWTRIKKAIFYQPDKLPFTFKRLGMQLFIDKNASGNKNLKSDLEILSINGVQVDAILTTLAQYVTADGSNYEKKLDRLSLTGSEKFSLFDIFYPIVFGSYDQFELELKNIQTGELFTEVVSATSKTNRTKILAERYDDLETSLRDGWSFVLIDDKTGILKIKSFAIQRNEFDWQAIIDNAFEELNRKEIPNLIIDLRENEGGQGEVGEYILERIIKQPFAAPGIQSSVRYLTIPESLRKNISTWDNFPYNFTNKVDYKVDDRYMLKQRYSVAGKTYKPKKNGYKGEVFLITDASNSSATHLMAAYAKKIERITLVGQETGGNQLGTNGSFIFFLRLPNTQIDLDIPAINMFVPPLSGKAVDGGIQPDVLVSKTIEDVISGRDVEVEKILSIINK